MLKALVNLIEIQRIDTKITNLDKEQATHRHKIDSLQKQCEQTKEQLNSTKDSLQTKIHAQRDMDMNLQLEIVKLHKWESRLNEIKQQRDYLALSREIETQKRANTEAEERLLTLSLDVEELQKRMHDLTAKQEEQAAAMQLVNESVSGRAKQLAEQIELLTRERAEFLSEIPVALLKRYDLVRAKRMGIALAAAANGRCGACNMGLLPQLYNIIQRGDSVESCPSCLRILYFQETPSQSDAASDA